MKTDRFYKNSHGKFVPSGTTVLPRPDLADWAAGCAVDYIRKEAYRAITNSEWFCDKADADSILLSARTAHLQASTEAAGYGTFMHWMCEQALKQKRPWLIHIPKTWTVPDEKPWKLEVDRKMTARFITGLEAWVEKRNVKVIAMEHEVVTDTYGGRLDLVCEMDSFWMTKAWCKRFGHEWYKGIDKQRVIALVDFKTGKGTYYDNWKYQLAGYRQAWNEAVTKTNICGTEIQHHGILKFNKETCKVNYKDFTEYSATRTKKDGKRVKGKLETEKYTRTYEMDRQAFNACVVLWWATKRGIKI